MTETKRCKRCGETKPLDEFHLDRSRPDQHQNWCKACASEYNRKRYEENSERRRQYYLTRRATKAGPCLPKYTYPPLGDREWLRQKYSVEFRHRAEIAEIVGCSASAVAAALQRHGIPTIPYALQTTLRARVLEQKQGTV